MGRSGRPGTHSLVLCGGSLAKGSKQAWKGDGDEDEDEAEWWFPEGSKRKSIVVKNGEL